MKAVEVFMNASFVTRYYDYTYNYIYCIRSVKVLSFGSICQPLRRYQLKLHENPKEKIMKVVYQEK